MRATSLEPIHTSAVVHLALASMLALAHAQPGAASGAVPSAGPQAFEQSPPTARLQESTGDATMTLEPPASAQRADRALAVPRSPSSVLDLGQVRAGMQAAARRRQEALRPDPAADNQALAERWGVEVIGVGRTSAGYMLDFRFKVLDASKAMPLFDHRVKPYVVAHKSDLRLPVPEAAKVGAFRPTNRGKNIRADRGYYILFANPDRYVKAGEQVSVVIGDFRVENLTVN